MRHANQLGWGLAAAALLALGGCGGVDHTALDSLEDCTNVIDDNGDGVADCEDPQCAGHAACLPQRELLCENGADDDGDGAADCADPDCNQHPSCHPTSETACRDGLDNDGDGATDCDDPDCVSACGEVCNDGVDNDGDGAVDCGDSDCAESPHCGPGTEYCDDGVDNDGDGKADCDDEDCQWMAACTDVEICVGGDDEDGDGLYDCDDPDCVNSFYCAENCFDGVDNDGDGDVDCDDSQCAGTAACSGSTSCLPAPAIQCEQDITSSTVGGPNNFNSYSCNPGPFGGPERYFRFTASFEGWVDVYLNASGGANLALVGLLGDAATGCDPSGYCFSELMPSDDWYSAYLFAGEVLYIIVDGPTGVADQFNVAVECVPAYETGFCDDGWDNDQDQLEDCWDPDCLWDPVCDYWISAGQPCEQNVHCAPGETCEQVTFNGGAGDTVGFCTRPCAPNGSSGGQCDTENDGPGFCTDLHHPGGARCTWPCTDPADVCPSGMVCTNYITGGTNISDVATNGFCLPNQP